MNVRIQAKPNRTRPAFGLAIEATLNPRPLQNRTNRTHARSWMVAGRGQPELRRGSQPRRCHNDVHPTTWLPQRRRWNSRPQPPSAAEAPPDGLVALRSRRPEHTNSASTGPASAVILSPSSPDCPSRSRPRPGCGACVRGLWPAYGPLSPPGPDTRGLWPTRPTWNAPVNGYVPHRPHKSGACQLRPPPDRRSRG